MIRTCVTPGTLPLVFQGWRAHDDEPWVVAYRSLVDEMMAAISAGPHPLDPAWTAELVLDMLADERALPVVSTVTGGAESIAQQVAEETESFSSSAASNAKSPETMVKILLLQQIDLAWWATAREFEARADLTSSPELVDLVDLRKDGDLRFTFDVLDDGVASRINRFISRRFLPRRSPGTAGMSATQVRPDMVAVLNHIAGEFANVAPKGTPSLHLNSVSRSMEQQRWLRSLGYSALIPSAHCRGWAADLEMTWFERFGARDALAGLLLEYRDHGLLNVIDEGQAWHVCPNPDALRYFRTVEN